MNFRPGTSPRIEPRIEITPLIDVVFQLLIFFLLTTSFVNQHILDVNLPSTNSSSKSEAVPDVVVLSVLESGRIRYGDRLLELGELDPVLRKVAAQAKRQGQKPTFVLRADRNVSHGQVVAVFDRALAHGLSRVAIATRPVDD